MRTEKNTFKVYCFDSKELADIPNTWPDARYETIQMKFSLYVQDKNHLEVIAQILSHFDATSGTPYSVFMRPNSFAFEYDVLVVYEHCGIKIYFLAERRINITYNERLNAAKVAADDDNVRKVYATMFGVIGE